MTLHYQTAKPDLLRIQQGHPQVALPYTEELGERNGHFYSAGQVGFIFSKLASQLEC